MKGPFRSILDKHLVGFMKFLRMQDYSPLTVLGYSQNLGQLFDWLEGQSQVDSLAAVTPTVLREFQMHLMLPRQQEGHFRGRPRILAAASRNRYLTAIKAFFRYLRRTGQLLSNPAAELERARVSLKLPKELPTVAEMRRLLNSITPDSDVAIHDRAVFELLYSSGLRRHECLGLPLKNLRLEENFVQILGKGNRERVVPVGREAVRTLFRYLKEVRPQWAQPDCTAVFVSKLHGRVYRGRELMERLRGYAKAAKIKKRLGFHVFRHACATHLLQGKADLRAIQLILGHVDLDVTARYLQVDPTRLRDVLLLHHPRETELSLPDDPPL